MEIQKKRKEELKNKKRNIFSMDEEVEGNDDMFDDVDFLNDEDKKALSFIIKEFGKAAIDTFKEFKIINNEDNFIDSVHTIQAEKSNAKFFDITQDYM